MNKEIKNLVRYIKCNGIKTSDEIVGLLVRANKKNKFNYHFRFSKNKKIFKYKYLGYITKKEYKLLKRKNIFRYISHGNSAYACSYNYVFRVSNHWGEFKRSKKQFLIDILDKSPYKNNFGKTSDFEGLKIYLVGVFKRVRKNKTGA